MEVETGAEGYGIGDEAWHRGANRYRSEGGAWHTRTNHRRADLESEGKLPSERFYESGGYGCAMPMPLHPWTWPRHSPAVTSPTTLPSRIPRLPSRRAPISSPSPSPKAWRRKTRLPADIGARPIPCERQGSWRSSPKVTVCPAPVSPRRVLPPAAQSWQRRRRLRRGGGQRGRHRTRVRGGGGAPQETPSAPLPSLLAEHCRPPPPPHRRWRRRRAPGEGALPAPPHRPGRRPPPPPRRRRQRQQRPQLLERYAQRRCKPCCCQKQNSRNQVLTGFEPPTPGRDPKVTPNESGCLLPTRLPMRLPRGLVTAGAFHICTRAILSETFAISHFLFLRF